MAKGVNKVILLGNLVNEPEVKYSEKGYAIVSITLATDETRFDQKSGTQYDRTERHRVVFFKRLAEIVGENLHKGSNIYVEGALRTHKWTDMEGIVHYRTEIIAYEMHMVERSNDHSEHSQRT